jgi:Tol biopolymer transport system component
MGLDISPDGKWVASSSVKQPSATVLLPTGAGQPVTLADGNLFHSQRLSFLPDGKGVIMVAAEPGKEPRTYVQMLDGSGPTPIGPERFRGFVASPDGKSVLGRQDRAAWIVPLSGSGAGQALPSITPDERAIGWTADGHSVYVLNFSSMPAKAYVMDINTGQRKLHHEFAPADPSGVPGVGGGLITPDGKFYIYGVPRTLSYLYVVEGLK